MTNWQPPILGLTASPNDPIRVVWRDGTVCGGILGTGRIDSEAEARWRAEEARKQQLRDRNIAILEDYRTQGDIKW